MGIADRSAFDLKVHSLATKVELVAREVFPEPRIEDVVVVKPDRKIVGKTFKADNVSVSAAIDALGEDPVKALALRDELSRLGSGTLLVGEKSFTLTADMVTITEEKRKVRTLMQSG